MSALVVHRRTNAEPKPFDGSPYYCVTCGLGYGEYLACEDGVCQLETPRQAQRRRQRNRRKLSGRKPPRELT